MSVQPPEDLPPVALEPDTLPEQPLTAAKAWVFVEKEVGLPSVATLAVVPHEPITPEPIRLETPRYTEGHWDYPRRCADVEAALTGARERVEEWDRDADPHGWWHERSDWIALHNEVLHLRALLGR